MTSSSAQTPFIQARDVHFSYQVGETVIPAVRGISLDIEAGSHVALLGHNGSGKSTFGRLLNGLLVPDEGSVTVDGLGTTDPSNRRDLFSTVGMVFQDPDSQIVATIVREDTAFGPENMGLPREKLKVRVAEALELAGLTGLEDRPPHMLSGGQRQRVAIAGVLALRPRCIIFDEATTMLDPHGQRGVMEVMDRLHEMGITIINITHLMDEAVRAERVVVLDQGQVVMDGTPREVFTRVQDLGRYHLDVPQASELASLLKQEQPGFPSSILSVDELESAVREHLPPLTAPKAADGERVPEDPGDGERVPGGEGDQARSGKPAHRDAPPLIDIRNLFHTYMKGTPMQVTALEDIDFAAHRGQIVAVIGHTGCGKSTLIQHFNGIIRMQRGHGHVGDHDLSDRRLDVRRLRQEVGLLFQRPESQLFEQLVGDDVAYGPLKMGCSIDEARERVRWALEVLGLPFDEFVNRPVFALSGGQKRKVALAGVLALKPQVLVLDEPTAGLDPGARNDLLVRIRQLQAESNMTVVFVSHNMREVADLANFIYVLKDGRNMLSGSPREVFAGYEQLLANNLGVPPVVELFQRLTAAGYQFNQLPLTVEEAASELRRLAGASAS